VAKRISFLFLFVSFSVAADSTIETGRRLYRDGVLPSGGALRATVADGAVLDGAQAACENCHRRSGLGTSEGGRVVPPIAGEALFRPRQPALPGLKDSGVSTTGARPAYQLPTLERVLREGVDSSGRSLSALMPRYAFDAEALRALTAYLRTLSTRVPAGVTAQAIHFATVVTPGVPAAERRAMVEVIEGFVQDHNAEIRQDTRRGERAVMGHSRAYRSFRKWRLHVWELKGSSETWAEQLERAVKQQPVFAMVSGIGRGPWQPVHDFCERREIPCLFPNTDLPPDETAFYSLYLSRGISLEADLVAQDIARGAQSGERHVIQVFRDNDLGRARAQALRHSLTSLPAVQLTDKKLDPGVRDITSWLGANVTSGKSDVVFWLPREDLARFGTIRGSAAGGRAVYLSSVLIGGPENVPAALRPVVRVIHPFDLPDRWHARRGQLESWLKAHNLTLGEERIQASTFLSMNLLTKAMKHVREPFSKEYLIERVEHVTENSVWRSVYREIGLGANAQRFASKGGYLLSWRNIDAREFDAEWVVPSAAQSHRMAHGGP
jgi:hypothetical protein